MGVLDDIFDRLAPDDLEHNAACNAPLAGLSCTPYDLPPEDYRQAGTLGIDTLIGNSRAGWHGLPGRARQTRPAALALSLVSRTIIASPPAVVA